MVPISTDHSADVVDRDQFPVFVANVLPARNFFQDQQADFITSIKKVARLRVVRGADDIALQLIAQNQSVTALSASRHRLANPGKCLVPVEPTQFDNLSI